jgi:hypothetical protein
MNNMNNTNNITDTTDTNDPLATIASLQAALDEVAKMAGKLKQQRDEAIKQIHEEAMDYELQIKKLCEAYNDLGAQNTKLRDIAENAIYELSSWDDGKYSSTSTRLRAELEQLKEGAK